jgi:hypothetical protein
MPPSTQAHLTEDQISMILDRISDQALQEHIVKCPDCQKRVEEARRIEVVLKQQLFRQDCPSPHKLTDYFIGILGVEDRNEIDDHLSVCVSCREELETLRRFIGEDKQQAASPEEGKIIHPPADYFVARLDMHQANRQARGQKRGKEKRQMRAQADGIVVLLDFQVVASGIAIEGTLIDIDESRNWIGSLVEFRKEDVLHTTCLIDELSTFHCQLIDGGNYKMRITSPTGGIVVVPDIMIDT